MQLTASIAIILLVFYLMLPEEMQMPRRKLSLNISWVTPAVSSDNINKSLKAAIRLTRPLKRILRIRFSENRLNKLRDDLRYINALRIITPEEFCYLKLLIALVSALYFGLQILLKGDTDILLMGTISTLIIYILPEQWLKSRVERRRSAIQRSVPYVFGLFTVLMDAGLSITQAMEEAGRQGTTPLNQELKKATEEIRLGVPATEALDNLARRTHVEEITYFASSVIQAMEKGNSGIAAIIRDHARFSWESRKSRARAQADKASMRLFIPLLFLVMPAMVIFLMGPMVFSLIETLHQGL